MYYFKKKKKTLKKKICHKEILIYANAGVRENTN